MLQNDDNQDLRIKFVVKEITEKRMKSGLMTRDKKKEKQQELIHICELMMAVYTETCINIHNMLLTFTNQRRPYDTSNHTAGSLLIQNILSILGIMLLISNPFQIFLMYDLLL